MSSSTPASSATGSRSTPSRSPRDGERVDAIGLAAVATGPALAGHQPRGDANDSLAPDEQEPFEGARDVPAVLQRPDALVLQATRPIQRGGEPSITDLDGPVAQQLAARRTDRGDGVRPAPGNSGHA